MFIQNLLSRHLRQPSGIAGIMTGHLMHWGNREMYGILLQESPPEQGDNIFEAGFGSGRHISSVLALNDKLAYSGIDLSPSMVRMAIRYNRSLVNENRVNLQVGDISDIPYPDSTFDRVITINTIYFWKDPDLVTRELSRVLKPGGKIILGANSRDEMVKQGYRSRYFNFWDRSEIEQLMLKNGLSISVSFHRKLKIEDCIGVIATK